MECGTSSKWLGCAMSTDAGDVVSGLQKEKKFKIGLIGYGEVGRILAEDLKNAGVDDLSACDIKVGTPAGDVLIAHARHHGVNLSSTADVLGGSDLVISAVTAGQTVEAAMACASDVRCMWFLDINSASPGAKLQACEIIERVNGRYVEAAVMSSVPPCRIRCPLILGGKHAYGVLPILEKLGFNASVGSNVLGVVSATKLCRSVMVKGLEALTLECYVAARAWGVESEVIASLTRTFPGVQFEKQGNYFFTRVTRHGKRRAEEMREAVKTLREVGVNPCMSKASAWWQDWVTDRGEDDAWGGSNPANLSWREVADRLIEMSDGTEQS